ncbi:cysteine-rich with EGF-like domain protein 2 [Tetranychus urticae]|uniref:Laminin EGF-like domain-containing protein n=1 Tax=Tetranychus urticae TaxID=32264 RepID=T1KFD4_TETUR|nr:cysteine-rich with EGF-like domain protein 2 [Tetranychus urticae]
MKIECSSLLRSLVINYFSFFLLIFLQINFIITSTPGQPSPSVNPDSSNVKINAKVRVLGPCQLCREVVRSFHRGFKNTDYSNVDHEVAKSTDFKDSSQRLIQIKEKLCSDAKNFEEQCKEFSSKHEQEIDHWWSDERKQGIGLHDYLCIDKGKVCCPDGMFGPNCSFCPGFPEAICNGHGSCKGNGTRKGNGKCVCYVMYKGELCEKCATGYFKISEKDGIEECEKCDKSCLGQCLGSGPKGCHACKEGYIWDTDYGCLDIDECIESPKNPCQHNTFCVNVEGSFQCFECDKACDGCHGDGPDSCTKCAVDFVMKEGICVDTKIRDREVHLEKSRYITYLGLCIATCIIFQKNIYIASIIGLLVALYITAAEYTVRDVTRPSNPLEEVAGKLFE